MKQVVEGVTLSTAGDTAAILRNWAQYLTPLFRDIGFRLNRSLPKDGSEGLTPYTLATRPASGFTRPGALIFVTDAAAGAKFQGWDGSAWVPLG